MSIFDRGINAPQIIQFQGAALFQPMAQVLLEVDHRHVQTGEGVRDLLPRGSRVLGIRLLQRVFTRSQCVLDQIPGSEAKRQVPDDLRCDRVLQHQHVRIGRLHDVERLTIGPQSRSHHIFSLRKLWQLPSFDDLGHRESLSIQLV